MSQYEDPRFEIEDMKKQDAKPFDPMEWIIGFVVIAGIMYALSFGLG